MNPPTIITHAELREERVKLNRLNNGHKVRDDEGACRFISERGFVLLMPIDGIPLPSLAQADEAAPWDGFAVTDRTWNWKETLPGQKLCAYTKLIRGRGTFISWRIYPSFLRMYGPEGDAAYEYENGRLDKASLDLYRIVADNGPIDSRELWRFARTIFGGKRTRFMAALEKLQSRFFLTVAGGSLEGWTLHTWDLVERQAPSQALINLPSIESARLEIVAQTIRNCYAITENKLRFILHLSPGDLKKSLEVLREKEWISEATVEGESLTWFSGCN